MGCGTFASILITCLASFQAPTAFLPSVPLFSLERSTNANEVVYELHPGESETDERLIHPFWRMLEQDGHFEELLNREQDVYGVQIKDTKNDAIVFDIKAMPHYDITAVTQPQSGLPFALIQVGGSQRILKRVYLRVGGVVIPSVKWIDLETATENGGSEYFRMIPSGDRFAESSLPCAPEWSRNCQIP